MPTWRVCEEPCQTLQLVRMPARTREGDPFDEWLSKWSESAASTLLDAMFHGAGEGWDMPIASSDEIDLIRSQSKARRHRRRTYF